MTARIHSLSARRMLTVYERACRLLVESQGLLAEYRRLARGVR